MTNGSNQEIEFVDPSIWYKLNGNGEPETILEIIKNYENMRKLLIPTERFINYRIPKIKEVSRNLSTHENKESHMTNKVDSVVSLHLIPIVDIISKPQLSVSEIKDKCSSIELIEETSSVSFQTDIEGFFAFCKRENHSCYTKVFRNRSIECITNSVVTDHNKCQSQQFSTPTMGSTEIARLLHNAIKSQQKLLQELVIAPPFLVHISFLGVEGIQMLHSLNYSGRSFHYDSSELYLPPSIIYSFDDKDNEGFHNAFVEQLNYLFNAFNLDNCSLLGQDGNLNFSL